MALKRILTYCSTLVDRNAVRRETINGVEHVIINSRTLPDDIVMNGGLYPAEEIAASFKTLERTLAPVEHPVDESGRFIPAADPIALHNFYAGAFNQNVTRENGRVSIDKVVNVQEAMKTERGRRLLDRINELETSNDPRPVHTSVGVFVEVDELKEAQQNAAGQDFTWIARNMVFDHDAILLDSVGAAQPSQGVGMAVNNQGDEVEVHQTIVDIESIPTERMTHSEIREALDAAIRSAPFNGDWVVDIFDDMVIFSADEQFFQASYTLDGRVAKIVDAPVPVSRDVTYVPLTNQAGDAMKEKIVNALKAAGIDTEGMDEDTLFAKYNELQAAKASEPGGDGGSETDAGAQAAAEGDNNIADAVTNALKPVMSEIEGLKATLNARDDEELNRLADIVGNSDKYPELNAEAAKKLGVETLKPMAANCSAAHGIPLTVHNGGQAGKAEPFAMPE